MIVIFAASFVIGGVGTGNQASLSDIFGNNGGASGTTTPTAAASARSRRRSRRSRRTPQPGRSSRMPTRARRSRADEASAWAKVNALKPGNMETLQRLALAQAQVATNNEQPGAAAAAGRPRASRPATTAPSPAARSARSREDPVTPGAGRGRAEQQIEVPDPGEHARQEGQHLVEALDRHLRQDRRAPGLREERPRRDDLAQLRLGRAERERHEDRDQGLRAFLKLAPDDVNAPQVKTILKQLKASTASSSTTATTP